MRILLAEDDYITRTNMVSFLSTHGECDIAVDGMEAVEAFVTALEEGESYDLVCLDIMMPSVDGYQALLAIREAENSRGISVDDGAKVIMVTALDGEKNVAMAYELGCTTYISKPVVVQEFEEALQKLGF